VELTPSTDRSGPIDPTRRPSGGLLLLRLILFCLVVGASMYPDWPGPGAQGLLWGYFAATLAFLLLYRRWRQSVWRRWARYAGVIQVMLEIAVEGALVAGSTNSIASPVVLLFVLTIVSASLQFRLVGTLLVATACSLAVTIALFVGVVGEDASLHAARDFSTVLHLNDDLFYALFLYVCGFYMAAFVSGYLSEKLELKDRALQGASRALELARLETDDILRHMQSGLLTLDSRGTLVYFNRTAEDILGLREARVTGRDCRDVFGERMPELCQVLLNALRSEQASARTELTLTTARGRVIPVGLSTSLMGSKDFGVRGVIAVFQDLTEAKRLEARVRVADRLAAVGELSASIAHEIRNPLATVTGSVEMLKQQVDLDAESRSLMELVLKESARLNRIVEDFLDFARIRRQSCEEVDLVALVGEVSALFEHHPDRKPGSRIILPETDDRPRAAAPREQVQQMMVNLIQNALEALPDEQGEVRIGAERCPPPKSGSQPFVLLTVTDNGPGIPAESENRIGRPFFSTKKKGTGLGIAIVQRLAMACGGSLRWANVPEGGARFVLRLPEFRPEYYSQEVSELVASQLERS